MSFDLSFRPTAEPPTLEQVRAYFAERRGYRPAAHGYTYENEDTGVYLYALVGERPDGLAPVTLSVNTVRPSSFGLEAEIEARMLAARFELDVADPGGEGAPYSTEGFLAEYEASNRAAHAVAVSHGLPAGQAMLPRWTLEHTWRWNHFRRFYPRFVDAIARLPCFIPTVLAVELPTSSRPVSTAVVWNEATPIALPAVDVVILIGEAGVRHVRWADVEPLLGAFQKHASDDWVGGETKWQAALTHWIVDDIAAASELVAALRGVAMEDGPKVVTWEHVLVEELVAEAVVLPVARAIGSGEPAPPDFAVALWATSGLTTWVTAVDGAGEVTRRSVSPERKEGLGTATPEELRALATAVVASGYPSFPEPDPPVDLSLHASVPPVRLDVSARGHSLSVWMPHATLVPAGFRAVSSALEEILARLRNTPEKRAEQAARIAALQAQLEAQGGELRAELVAMTRGERFPDVRAVWSSALFHEIGVHVWKTKVYRSVKERKSGRTSMVTHDLGEATTEEILRVVEALLAAGAPDFKPVPAMRGYPKIGVTILFEDGSERGFLGTEEQIAGRPELRAALDAMHAIAARFGPIAPAEDPSYMAVQNARFGET